MYRIQVLAFAVGGVPPAGVAPWRMEGGEDEFVLAHRPVPTRFDGSSTVTMSSNRAPNGWIPDRSRSGVRMLSEDFWGVSGDDGAGMAGNERVSTRVGPYD